MVYSKVATKTNGWTPERRARQAALIRAWKPWERSTGPRTTDGKARSSANRRIALEAAYQAVHDSAEAYRQALAKLDGMKRQRWG